MLIKDRYYIRCPWLNILATNKNFGGIKMIELGIVGLMLLAMAVSGALGKLGLYMVYRLDNDKLGLWEWWKAIG